MEAIDRNFKPGVGRMAVLLLVLLIALLFIFALFGSIFEGQSRRAADAATLMLVAYLAGAVVFLFTMAVTRLRLHSDGMTIEARILVAGRAVFRRSAAGPSWHVLATTGRTQIGEAGLIEGAGSYRVEVATGSGERVLFLGPFVCWFFRIDCL